MKKTILFTLLFAGTLFLAACEGTGSVQSGVGNADDDGDTTDNIDNGYPSNPIFPPVDNPYNCPVPETIVRSDCSIQSQIDCKCMLP